MRCIVDWGVEVPGCYGSRKATHLINTLRLLDPLVGPVRADKGSDSMFAGTFLVSFFGDAPRWDRVIGFIRTVRRFWDWEAKIMPANSWIYDNAGPTRSSHCDLACFGPAYTSGSVETATPGLVCRSPDVPHLLYFMCVRSHVSNA